MGKGLNKVIMWTDSSGFVSIITYVNEDFKNKDETDDDAILRMLERMKNGSRYKLLIPNIKNRAEMESTVNGSPVSHPYDKLKIDSSGNLKIDEKIKTKIEILEEKKQLIKNKLKNGTPLSDEDVDIILK